MNQHDDFPDTIPVDRYSLVFSYDPKDHRPDPRPKWRYRIAVTIWCLILIGGTLMVRNLMTL